MGTKAAKKLREKSALGGGGDEQTAFDKALRPSGLPSFLPFSHPSVGRSVGRSAGRCRKGEMPISGSGSAAAGVAATRRLAVASRTREGGREGGTRERGEGGGS